MYEHLKETLESFTDIDVAATPNFQAMIRLREELIRLESEDDDSWFTPDVANGVAARCKIDLSGLDNMDQVDSLVVPFAAVVYKLTTAMLDAGFSVSDVNAMAGNDLSLTLS